MATGERLRFLSVRAKPDPVTGDQWLAGAEAAWRCKQAALGRTLLLRGVWHASLTTLARSRIVAVTLQRSVADREVISDALYMKALMVLLPRLMLWRARACRRVRRRTAAKCIQQHRRAQLFRRRFYAETARRMAARTKIQRACRTALTFRYFRAARFGSRAIQAWWRGVSGVWQARRQWWRHVHEVHTSVCASLDVLQSWWHMQLVRNRYVHMRAATVFIQVCMCVATWLCVPQPSHAVPFACLLSSGSGAACCSVQPYSPNRSAVVMLMPCSHRLRRAKSAATWCASPWCGNTSAPTASTSAGKSRRCSRPWHKPRADACRQHGCGSSPGSTALRWRVWTPGTPWQTRGRTGAAISCCSCPASLPIELEAAVPERCGVASSAS